MRNSTPYFHSLFSHRVLSLLPKQLKSSGIKGSRMEVGRIVYSRAVLRSDRCRKARCDSIFLVRLLRMTVRFHAYARL